MNEQWPNYWQERFRARGFRMLDVIRPRVCEDPRVRWWYRQNLMLYADDTGLTAHPLLRAASCDREMEWVHVNMLREAGVRNVLCFQKLRS